MDEVKSIVRDAMQQHETQSHHPSMQELTGLTPGEIVQEYLDMRVVVRDTAKVNKRIIEVLEGPTHTNLAGVEVQRTEQGMRHKVDVLVNGGTPIAIPWTKIMIAVIGQAGIITAAILVWAK